MSPTDPERPVAAATRRSRASADHRDGADAPAGVPAGAVRTSASTAGAASVTRTPRTAKLDPSPGARAAVAIGLGVVFVAVLFLIDALAPTLFDASLPTRAQDGLTLAISVLIESLPFVVLGVVLSIVVQVWVPPGVIERWMPRAAWARRAVLSLLGMFVPVCECGNVPFARGLLMRGFSVPETMTFLIAAPIVNPIVIITTHQAFGFDDGILIARLLGGYAIANLIGWLYSRHPSPDGLLTERFRDTCALQQAEGRGTGVSGHWRRSLAQLVVEFRAVMPALIIGSALAGAVQVLIPREALLAIGANPALSIVAMIALAMVVSICSNVDSFFALSFASTFTPGAIVAFLLVGPIVDVKMLALLRTTFTTRTLVGISTVVILSAFAIGAAVNLLV